MRTSLLRYDAHPVTQAPITGSNVPEWGAIASLAIQTHAAFPHRLMLGWDIALTPEGPIMLEGNTNFDVMFLQRVHDAPAAHSRFGALMDFHIDALRRQRLSAAQ
jgi:Sugar-transfer associated ATP-grasp